MKDDFTWVKNKHSFKFGYDMLHMRQDQWSLGTPSGSFSFDGAAGLSANCPANKLSGSSTCPNTGGIGLALIHAGFGDVVQRVYPDGELAAARKHPERVLPG